MQMHDFRSKESKIFDHIGQSRPRMYRADVTLHPKTFLNRHRKWWSQPAELLQIGERSWNSSADLKCIDLSGPYTTRMQLAACAFESKWKDRHANDYTASL